jgi:Mn2+/Fe2+ NRAMP family transporter
MTRWQKGMAFFGPGLLIATVYIDPGQIVVDMETGSAFQYRMLWAMLAANAMGLMFQHLCSRCEAMLNALSVIIMASHKLFLPSPPDVVVLLFLFHPTKRKPPRFHSPGPAPHRRRLAIVTGRNLAVECRLEYPRGMRVFLWLTVELASIAADLGYVMGTATALTILTGIDLHWAGLGALLPVLTRGLKGAWLQPLKPIPRETGFKPLLSHASSHRYHWGVLLTGFDTFLALGLQSFGIRKVEALVGGLFGLVVCCYFVELLMVRPSVLGVVDGLLPRLWRGAAHVESS